ncbi:MAG: Kelch repeat-containing protein [Gammaproteobacteria bacterium]
MPNALAEDALTIDAPSQVRLPLANHNGGIKFQAKNIQVEAGWEVLSDDVALTINNGVLTFPSTLSTQQAVATIIVEDRFNKLNSNYTNLAATAVITIQFIAYDPKIFIAGGRVSSTDNSNDGVWSSTDGKNWQQCNAGFFTSRSSHAMAVKGRLYVFGGRTDTSARFNDVWSTVDCTTWQPETDSADWTARRDHAVAVRQNTFFLSGGNSGNDLNGVWSTTNGKNWVELKSSFYQASGNPIIDWGPRNSHRMVSYKGTLYITGGYYNLAAIQDVWSSVGGTNWSLEDSPPWAGRYNHGFVKHNNLLYLMGGQGTSKLNDVWSSADGKNWTSKGSMGGGSRSSFGTVSYKGRLYIMGGVDSSNNAKNDVWSSADGQTWSLETSNAGWSARRDHSAAVFPPE